MVDARPRPPSRAQCALARAASPAATSSSPHLGRDGFNGCSRTAFDTSHGGGCTNPLASSFAVADAIVRAVPVPFRDPASAPPRALVVPSAHARVSPRGSGRSMHGAVGPREGKGPSRRPCGQRRGPCLGARPAGAFATHPRGRSARPRLRPPRRTSGRTRGLRRGRTRRDCTPRASPRAARPPGRACARAPTGAAGTAQSPHRGRRRTRGLVDSLRTRAGCPSRLGSVVSDDDGCESARPGALELRLDERPVLGMAPCALGWRESSGWPRVVSNRAREIGEAAPDLEVGPRLSGGAFEAPIGPERRADEADVVDGDRPGVEERHLVAPARVSERADQARSISEP